MKCSDCQTSAAAATTSTRPAMNDSRRIDQPLKGKTHPLTGMAANQARFSSRCVGPAVVRSGQPIRVHPCPSVVKNSQQSGSLFRPNRKPKRQPKQKKNTNHENRNLHHNRHHGRPNHHPDLRAESLSALRPDYFLRSRVRDVVARATPTHRPNAKGQNPPVNRDESKNANSAGRCVRPAVARSLYHDWERARVRVELFSALNTED